MIKDYYHDQISDNLDNDYINRMLDEEYQFYCEGKLC